MMFDGVVDGGDGGENAQKSVSSYFLSLRKGLIFSGGK